MTEAHCPIIESPPSPRADDDNTRCFPSQLGIYITLQSPHGKLTTSHLFASVALFAIATSSESRKHTFSTAKNYHSLHNINMGNGILYRWEVGLDMYSLLKVLLG